MQNTTANKIDKIASTPWLPAILFILPAVVLTALQLARGVNDFGEYQYTFYNNYVIFKNAFWHLIEGKNMYVLYPEAQWDLYKYSPTFALLMAPLAILPDWLGLLLWNVLNHWVLYMAFRSLPYHNRNYGLLLATLFVFQELYVATANAQSNALIAGMLVWALRLWQQDRPEPAILLIALATIIKPFAIVFYLFWFFFDHKGNNLLIALGIGTALAVLPAFAVGPEGLFRVYAEWFTLLREDHDASFGLSLLGLIQLIFNTDGHKNIMVLLSVMLLLAPLFRKNLFSNIHFQYHYAAILLIWMVLFNHRAESPTFIIAIVGTALWYFTGKRTVFETTLLFFALVITEFSTSDVFPSFIREQFFKPFLIKAIPMVVLWFYLVRTILIQPFKTDIEPAPRFQP